MSKLEEKEINSSAAVLRLSVRGRFLGASRHAGFRFLEGGIDCLGEVEERDELDSLGGKESLGDTWLFEADSRDGEDRGSFLTS